MACELNRVEKHFFNGTHRINSPEETEKRALPLMKTIGAGPLTDITGSDSVGIPCCYCTRSRVPRGGTNTHPGKGIERVLARVSSMMAAIERYYGEFHGEQMHYASFEEVGMAKAVDPASLILPRPLERGEKLHWTMASDILNNEEILIPSNAVYFPYDTMGMTMPLFQSDPLGLASGNVREEAILYSLLELLECDAMSRAERLRNMGTKISVDSDGQAYSLLEKFRDAGIVIHLWHLHGRTNIPVIAAASDDPTKKDPGLLLMGSGCHPDPEIAVIRALIDVAFNRASYLHGDLISPSRETFLSRVGYDRMKRINSEWFAEAPESPLSSLRNVSSSWIDEDIHIILDELRGNVERVCVVDLPQTPVPVVRVVVPGLEVSHLHKNRKITNPA